MTNRNQQLNVIIAQLEKKEEEVSNAFIDSTVQETIRYLIEALKSAEEELKDPFRVTLQ